MKTQYFNYLLVVSVLCFLGLFSGIVAAADLHVDAGNTGGSWDGTIAHPYSTIQAGVNQAVNLPDPTTIAVAAGTYAENINIDQHVVVLQGGYTGDFSSRAPSTNITTIQGTGSDAVVTLNYAGASTVDGFTITGGNGSPEYLNDFYAGGGIFILGGAPVISNNIIENNDITHSGNDPFEAGLESQGGGIFTAFADTRIVSNTIHNNSAGYGGGIKVDDGNVTIESNTISSNIGVNDHGGGIHASGSSLEITGNVIENNSIGVSVGYGQGGGIIVYGDGTTATLTGNVVRGNTAPYYGAGEFVDDGATAVLQNELIYSNTLSEDDGLGAGIYVDGWDSGSGCVTSNVDIINVTVADNTCGVNSQGCGLAVDTCAQTTVSNSIFRGHQGLDFYIDNSSVLTATYTSSQQTFSGAGNNATDPLFANTGSDDYHLKSRGGRWDPLSSTWVTDTLHSPAIDAGNPASPYTTEPQPNGARVNMGAFGNTDQASKAGSRGGFTALAPVYLLLLGKQAEPDSWESRGIGGGGALYHPAISPHDPDLLYMATDMSGVYTSSNYGESWDLVNFLRLTGGDSSNIRFTSSTQTLYAINQDGTDYSIPSISTDAGKTWSSLATDPTSGEAYSLYADHDSTQRLIVSDYDTIFFSDNGGQSFSTVRSSSDLHVAGVFWDGTNIYIGTSDGLIVSNDNGQNFTLSTIIGILADEKMSSFAGAKQGGTTRLFAVTLYKEDVWPGMTGAEFTGFMGVYTWSSGDAAWSATATNLTDVELMFFVAMAPGDINTVYIGGGNVSTSFPLVYKSTDGGATWSSVLITDNNQNIVTGWCGDDGDLNWWYPEYILGLGVCSTDPNRVIITDLGFVHVTSNGGTSWRQAYVKPQFENNAGSPTPKGRAYTGAGMENTSVWSLHWTGSGNNTVIASFTDIQGVRSTDGGKTWVSGAALGLDHNTTYMVVEHPTSGRLFAATSPVHDMYQSTYLADAPIEKDQDGHIKYSDDHGATWNVLHDFDYPVVWLALDPNNANTLYASVVNRTLGDIYRTTNLDAGTLSNWSRLSSPSRTEGHPYNIRVLNDGNLVVSYSGRMAGGVFTESSGVFLSTDNGANWQDRSADNMHRWTKDIVIDPHDATQNTWYAAVFSHWGTAPIDVGGLYKTTDRGQNWIRLTNHNRVDSCAIHPSNSEVMYLSTETQGLWRTNNLSAGSPTFTQLQDYPFQHPVRMFFHPDNADLLWVTSYGAGLMVKNMTAP